MLDERVFARACLVAAEGLLTRRHLAYAGVRDVATAAMYSPRVKFHVRNMRSTRVSVEPAHAELMALMRVALAPGALTWRVHGIGVAQAYLTPDVRLHIWHARFMAQDRKREFAHTHRWPMTSHVLVGSLSHVEVEVAPGSGWRLWAHGDSDVGHRLPECLPGIWSQSARREQRIEAGNVYEFDAPTQGDAPETGPFHETWAEDLTLTLVRRGVRGGRSVAIIPDGIQPMHGLDMLPGVDPAEIVAAMRARVDAH